MAWFESCLYFIALLYFANFFPNVVSEDDEEVYEFYLCLRRQICECEREGGADIYGRCYSLLEDKNQQWLLEEMSKCNLGKITSYNDIVVIICSNSAEEFYPCALETYEKLKKKIDELSKNLMTTREYAAMEASRSCVLPGFSSCVDDPDYCL